MTDTHETGEKTVLLDDPAPGVRQLTLNRPARRNALTADLLKTLYAGLTDARESETIRCVLLTGAGEGFCAGQDLNDRDPRTWDAPPDIEAIQRELFHPIIKTMRDMAKPVVVAVHGVAAGAGSSIALAGDVVLAAHSAKFVQSFSKVGLSVDAGGGWALVNALGPARARGLLLTGDTLSGEAAAQAGLIWRAVAEDALHTEALALATTLATGPTKAFAAIKSAVTSAENSETYDQYLQTEAALQGSAGYSNDYREGVLAFLEKRQARFSGK